MMQWIVDVLDYITGLCLWFMRGLVVTLGAIYACAIILPYLT